MLESNSGLLRLCIFLYSSSQKIVKGEARKMELEFPILTQGVWRELDEHKRGRRKMFINRANPASWFSSCSAPSQAPCLGWNCFMSMLGLWTIWADFVLIQHCSSTTLSAGILEQSMEARNQVRIGLSYRPARAGIFKKSMGARHRVGIGLSYRHAMLHRLAELMPWHRFLGSMKV